MIVEHPISGNPTRALSKHAQNYSEMRHQIKHRSRRKYLEIRLIRQIEQSPSVTYESPSNSEKPSTPEEGNPWEFD